MSDLHDWRFDKLRPVMPKKEAVDYHIVPRTERQNHQYNGAECACEPRCVLQSPSVRVFLHQTHLIDVLRFPPHTPKGLLGPGK